MGARGSSGDSGGSRPQGASEPLPAQKSLPCEAPVVVRTSPAKENYDTPRRRVHTEGNAEGARGAEGRGPRGWRQSGPGGTKEQCPGPQTRTDVNEHEETSHKGPLRPGGGGACETPARAAAGKRGVRPPGGRQDREASLLTGLRPKSTSQRDHPNEARGTARERDAGGLPPSR